MEAKYYRNDMPHLMLVHCSTVVLAPAGAFATFATMQADQALYFGLTSFKFSSLYPKIKIMDSSKNERCIIRFK